MTARVSASGTAIQVVLTDPASQPTLDRLVAAGEGVRLLDPHGRPAEAGGRASPDWQEVVRGDELVPGAVHLEPSPEMRPVVAMTFGPDAAARLAAWTSDHIGSPLVVAVGERIVSVPVISDPMVDGGMALSLVDDEVIGPLISGLWSGADVTFERVAG